uniref:Pco147721a n=1 Tax=Arundo donax TaxID=35708 RepID=A0A0A9FV20_ARUDO
MTGGGADYSFECIGVSSVMTDAFRSTKPVVILSMHPPPCDKHITMSSFRRQLHACSQLIATRVRRGRARRSTWAWRRTASRSACRRWSSCPASASWDRSSEGSSPRLTSQSSPRNA